MVVIGGLMQNKTTEEIAATPVLGKIPFVGTMFRHTKQVSLKRELVILVRPIVVGRGDWNKRINASAQRFKHLRRGYHLGDKSHIFGTEGERY